MPTYRRFLWLAPAFLLVAGLVFSMTVSTKTYAASTITISTCDATHLDSALSTAQASSGNTINFACSGDIILDKTLFITTTLTIDGSGQSVTLDGNLKLQVFAVTRGANLTLNTLTIADGNAGLVNGGGIDNSGTVTISNSTLSNNSSANGGGAGIYNHGGTVSISTSTLSNNSAINDGGGIYNDGGTVSITNSTLSTNSARVGAGIANGAGGTVNISSSTLSNNSASILSSTSGVNSFPYNGSGGGIYNDGGTVNISTSTLSHDSAADLGGGIVNFGTMSIANSTLYTNNAVDGGGIYNTGTVSISTSTLSNNSAGVSGDSISNAGTMTSSDSIVVGNTSFGNSQQDCNNSIKIIDQGYNLESGTSCGFNGTGSKQNTYPRLASALANNGGPTQTLALQDGSPAINAIPAISCSASTDQRGIARPQGPACDIGAFEYQVPTISVPATITTKATSSAGAVVTYSVTGTEPDDASVTPTISCTPASGGTFPIGTTTVNCSASDAATPPDVTTGSFQVVVEQAASVTFTVTTCTNDSQLQADVAQANTDNNNDIITFSCSGDILLTKTLNITGSMTMNGSGQSVTLDGNKTLQILHVNSGANLILHALTIANGYVSCSASSGGTGCGKVGAGSGGGIFNAGGTVSVTNSTLSGNTATGGGGGISNSGGTVSVTNSTLSGNTASNSSGGGILNLLGTVSLSNSTLSGNTASNSGGGIDNLGGTVTSLGSIIAENSATSNNDCINQGGTITDQGYNLESGTDCGFTGTGSLQNTNPMLASALANNGGSTQTLALQQGSPAIDQLPVASCPATDQRGYPRPDAGESTCDMGAYESSSPTPVQMLTALASHIQQMNIANGGVKYSLWVKIENAKLQVQKKHTTSACNVLSAFLHEVQAQTGKALTASQAQDLTSKVQQIQTALGC